MSEILRIEHLTKIYGNKKAVDDLSTGFGDVDNTEFLVFQVFGEFI